MSGYRERIGDAEIAAEWSGPAIVLAIRDELNFGPERRRASLISLDAGEARRVAGWLCDLAGQMEADNPSPAPEDRLAALEAAVDEVLAYIGQCQVSGGGGIGLRTVADLLGPLARPITPPKEPV